jgi:hypothetical protein
MKILLVILSFGLLFNSNAKDWEHKNISTAVFATDVVKRMPQNIVSEIDTSVNKIFFYTNFRNLAGQNLKHRWIYNGKNMAEVEFAPKGNRWRVYSSKNLWKGWTGVWSVEVVDSNDNILLTKSFTYNKK